MVSKSSGSSRIIRLKIPSVTTSICVFALIFEPKRTRKPTRATKQRRAPDAGGVEQGDHERCRLVHAARGLALAAAVARQVGRQHAVAGLGEWWHEFAVEIGPGRLPVEQQDWGGIARPFIDVVEAQRRRAWRIHI